MIRTVTALVLALVPAAAAAEAVLKVDYQASGTNESFRVANVAPCEPVAISEVSMNLETAEGSVFFDTAPGGPGYDDNDLPPIDIVRGDGFVNAVDMPDDGGRTILFSLADFTGGKAFDVRLDVDAQSSTRSGRGTDLTVRDLEGATVSAMITNPAGEIRAEVGVMVNGVATVTWDLACAGAAAD